MSEEEIEFKWYVLQVVSGKENRAKELIECFIMKDPQFKDSVRRIVIPSENVSEVKRGEQTVREKKIWPGYILVNMVMSDDAWNAIRSLDNVIGFLGKTPLTEKEVNSILRELEAKKGVIVQKYQFKPGDQVKITEGVFVDFVGTVMEVFQDKGKVSVMLSIFGRETRVDDLEFWQVEQLTK